ncbi:MAG: hypothetical protein KatS3mg060_3213 [Dehalococcoidia bacterium]|nr:MAG: hypothetical protein KatS3mg060_3213 [Dehalococcoidia bacterium]
MILGLHPGLLAAENGRRGGHDQLERDPGDLGAGI